MNGLGLLYQVQSLAKRWYAELDATGNAISYAKFSAGRIMPSFACSMKRKRD